jgi:hypothetical protein
VNNNSCCQIGARLISALFVSAAVTTGTFRYLYYCTMMMSPIHPATATLLFWVTTTFVLLLRNNNNNTSAVHAFQCAVGMPSSSSSPSPSWLSPGTHHDWTARSVQGPSLLSAFLSHKAVFPLYMAPRSKRITQLTDWAQSDAVGIQISRTIRLDESPDAGIGWRMASTPSSSDDGGGGGASANKSSSLLITVPSATALTVECPGISVELS